MIPIHGLNDCEMDSASWCLDPVDSSEYLASGGACDSELMMQDMSA